MIRNLLLLAALTVLVSEASAQSPVYLLFTKDCVDQLEYRAAYGNNSWLVYSLKPTADAQFLLKAGDTGIRSKNKPAGTRTCREFVINDAFADVVNRGERPVYMVHQDADGFMLMPLVACTQITRYGSVLQFRAPRFGFAIDSNNLVTEQNLASPSSDDYLYFNGIRFRNCRNEYSFRKLAVGAGKEQSDFDFISGIGITTDKTGKTASEAEANLYRLTQVNGMALDDYIASMCKNTPAAPPTTVSKWSGEANYGNATVPDKETASVAPIGPPPPAAATGPLPVECTEAPGYGYHLVMPGESLNAIARSYRVDLKNLIKWNKIKNPNHLEVCQKVWLMQPPKGANMISTRKNAMPPAPVQHSTQPEKYQGPTIVKQDGLWGKGTQAAPVAPATYNTQQTLEPYNPYASQQQGGYISPIVYSNTGGTPPAAPAVVRPPSAFSHVVKPKETVSGLARYYGITEECLRHQNNLPPTGDATIYIGQTLRIAMCDPGTTSVYTPAQYGYTPHGNPDAQQANPNYDIAADRNYIFNPQTGAYEYNPKQNDANYQYNPATGRYEYVEPKSTRPGAFLEGPRPTEYNTKKPSSQQQEEARPDVFDETRPINSGGNQQAAKGVDAKPAQYFKEYVVQQGDNLRSIAIRHNISTAELAQMNAMSETESLMPGKRLVVPR
ncbi:MAG TPA: LysM peptidoglycan-binding domain-containing protein [Saprospiraceae bacterium]|nr:LysM peptidoglycan-binding domain-containing protein [Saprospiraceae bacterium]